MARVKKVKSEETNDIAPVSLPATKRTSAGLRTILFDELDGLRNGTITSTRANAVAKIAMTIVETVRMEVDVMRWASKAKSETDTARLGEPLELVPEAKEKPKK